MTWDACTMEPSTWLRWIECHPALGSWIQGIGTLLAILVAVWVPMIIRSREEHYEQTLYEKRLLEIISPFEAAVSGFLDWLMEKKEKLKENNWYLVPRVAEMDELLKMLRSTNNDELLKARAQAVMPYMRKRIDLLNQQLQEHMSGITKGDKAAIKQAKIKVKALLDDLKCLRRVISGRRVERDIFFSFAYLSRFIQGPPLPKR